jgi:PPOX class probable F420-dependent enzyme
MDRTEMIEFVRARGLAVVASRGPDGAPQAALVGIAATDVGELIFDTSRDSRKYANIERHPQVAVVVGWEDEVTVQIEGSADVLSGDDLTRCTASYFDQFPDGRERAESPEIGHIRITPHWVRHADFRPDTFGSSETHF